MDHQTAQKKADQQRCFKIDAILNRRSNQGETQEKEHTGHKQLRMVGIENGPAHEKQMHRCDPGRHLNIVNN